MLESFPDQLGKHMQIHELTRRKLVREASVVGSIASNIATQAINKVLPGVNAAAGTVTSGGNAASTAGKFSQEMAKPLALQLQSAWTQMVQSKLKDSGVTSLSQITNPTEAAQLKPRLAQLINKMVGGSGYSQVNYMQLPGLVQKDPATQETAFTAVETITQMIDEIYKETLTPSGAAALTNSFLTLTQTGVLPAQQLLQFNRLTDPNQPAAPTSSPAAKELAKELGIDAAGLAAAQASARKDPAKALQAYKELMNIR